MVTETASATSFALHTGGGGGGKIKRSSFKSRGGVTIGGVGVVGGGGGGPAGVNGVRGYRAVRVTVPSTVVAELASKFNAVVVDADRGDTARDIIKKVNKTLAKGAAVRATVEKFESAAEKRHGGGGGGGNVVVVRTNSDQRGVDHGHHRNHHNHHPHHNHHHHRTTAVPPKSPPPPPSSIVRRRMEQFQNGKKPQKPGVLGPKPKVTAVAASGGQRRAMQKDVAAEVDCRRLLNKHKRLSIARDPDARLESVLNTTPSEETEQRPLETEQRPLETEQLSLETEQQRPLETEQRSLETEQRPLETEQRPLETEQRPSETEQEQRLPSAQPPAIRPKPNSSFLHGRTRRTADDGAEQRPPPVVACPSPVACASPVAAAASAGSFLHGKTAALAAGDADDARPQHDYNYIDHCGARPCPPPPPPAAAIYEELLCDIQRSAAAATAAPDPSPLPDVVPADGSVTYYDDHYTTIGDGGEQNIYDDVQLPGGGDRERPAEEDGSYETVEAPPPPLPPVPQPPQLLHQQQQQQQQGDDRGGVHDDRDGLYENGDGREEDVDDDDDDGRTEKKSFDVSVEIDNSIYGMNPPSESTSSGVTSDSVSADRNSKFDLDEEWVDVDNTSDELQEIIVFRQKPKMTDSITKGWSIQVQKQLTKAYEIEKTNAITGQEIPEEIYADYDSFDSDDSWDDCRNREKVNRVPYPCENRDLPAPPSQQNIYGLVPLVKRAGNRMKKRWSFGSLGLNRIRKLSVGNLTSDFGLKTFDTASEKSADKKFIPSANGGLSSSVFYLNDPVYNNIENDQIRAPVRNASRPPPPPSSVDSRRLSVARPSSPPPPPPVKRHSTGSNAYGSLPRSICNSKGRPASLLDRNNAELTSENGSNPGSDHLYMRFADEPLYQFYAADISERTKSVFAGDVMEECDGYEEISSITSRPSALELITPCLTGHGQHRSLWCEVPEVKNSGIIDTLSPRERKLQEAKFELITSEASYFKSLTVLEKHFVNSHSMNDETILSKNDRKILFGNVNPVRKCSEKLLAVLEKCWQDDILLKGLSEILYNHSKENFEIFVKYCSNQIYIDRTLKSLRDKNLKFNEALHRLESDPKCQSLSLHSFLMLPMQRITRLPLLVDAILSQMDSEENSLEYQMCELTLASLNTIVQNCNESTRKLERYEEMLLLSQQLEFSSKKEMKAMSVASSSRWLVRSGSMLHLTSPDAKLTLSRKFVRPTKLYFFLFNDMFFIAKRKSEENYTVVDYCARNFVQMVDATELVITSSYKNLLMLTILENHEAKTIEMLLSCDSESSKKRWIEALSPPISSNPDETLYNEWDCPQVFVEHAYTAIQPDELSLQNGDIVKVLTKMNDGWYHGERIRDGEKGWFPGNYTSEIASQHARAKNLKQRYRLLAMSGSYLQSQQDKIKKK